MVFERHQRIKVSNSRIVATGSMNSDDDASGF